VILYDVIFPALIQYWDSKPPSPSWLPPAS
jgi:hypothetical protein